MLQVDYCVLHALKCFDKDQVRYKSGASWLLRHNSNLLLSVDVREARPNDTRAGTLPCERQRVERVHVRCLRCRTSRLRDQCFDNRSRPVYLSIHHSGMDMLRLQIDLFYEDRKLLHDPQCCRCSDLGGIAASQPECFSERDKSRRSSNFRAVGSGNPPSRNTPKDDI